MTGVTQDLRYALRQLRKNPGFALTATLILSLGMGASVAIFGFVDTALLHPLPYRNPERLMSVNESNKESPRWPLSYPDYLDWERLNKSFSSLDIYAGVGYLLRTPSGAVPVDGERISGGFFRTLGVNPVLGRDFYPGEDRVGGPNVVILSYGGWVHHFGARRDVVGQTVELDNQPYTIVGVLPRAFSFARAGDAEFWVPINTLSYHEQMRTFYNFWGIGRLRDGVSAQTALADLRTVVKQLQLQYSTADRYEGVSILPLSDVILGDVRPILLMFLAGAVLLLLIACVNAANLVLVRSENRGREFAVRAALGASRRRVVVQFATEGLLLALAGSLAGLFVAGTLMKFLMRVIPKDTAASMPFLEGATLNLHTGWFALAVAVMAALLLTVTPILWFSSADVRGRLGEDRGATSQLWRRLGGKMVVAELAVAVVLLVAAGLLQQSLYRLLHVPLGFDSDHLATVQVESPETYKNDARMVGLYREILRRVSSLPGVVSAGMTSMIPARCDCAVDWISFPGKPFHGEHNTVDERHVSADYLHTLQGELVRGNFFTDAADTSTPGVAVINQALARKYFKEENPIGQRIADDEGGRPSIHEIFGVIADVREGPLDGDISPAEYFPINQTQDSYFTLVVRTRQDPGALLPVLGKTLHQIDLNLGVSDEETMGEQVGRTRVVLLHHASAWLVGLFAVVALILAVVGLYGVIAYSVSQRTREIGVRIALGAQRNSVYGLVLRESTWLTGIGLAIGLVCAIAASLLIRNLLFGVQPWDAATLTCISVVLGLASMVASYIPARRAANVDPMVALRYE
jgi:macrolide transport system ATP-binding/permease protein